MKDHDTRRWVVFLVIVLVAAAAVGLYWSLFRATDERQVIRFGITPYQDTALPVVADELGWYEEAGIKLEFVPVSWGDVMLALSSGAIDASIYTINSFQSPYEASVQGSRKPIFYCPIYVFKGTAIMVHGDSGITPMGDLSLIPESQREAKVVEIAGQLKGRRIAVTEGTEFEQIVLAALEKAGLSREGDAEVFHAAVEDALAGFLSGDIDAFGAGLTERVEARRRGAVELLVASDVGPPSIDGIVTTAEFAEANKDILDTLIRTWFRTIRFMENDLRENSVYVRNYLENKASTKYSGEEYAIAWTFNVFPRSVKEAREVFQSEQSPYFWQDVWDYNNEFLRKQGKISGAVPYSAYWGRRTLEALVGGENAE